MITEDGPKTFFMVDLKRGLKVKPSAFTLANCFDGNLADFYFEASNDGKEWTSLNCFLDHDESTISDNNDSNNMCWNVECDMFFKFFRIFGASPNKEVTGPNEEATGPNETNMYDLFVKGFEMYGELQMH